MNNTQSQSSQISVGIIGGLGKFGKFIATLLVNKGIRPCISDINTPLTNIQLVNRVSMVIIAVSIDKTLEVIEEIAPHLTENHVVVDITSIKTPIVRALLKTKADVVSVHPMFNPSIQNIANQTIILIPARDSENWQKKIERFCQSHQVKTKLATAEYHDKMMALIQVLVHYNTISIGITMSKLGFDIKETLEFTSPIYRMELAMIGRIFAQDGRLYGNIPMYNEHTPEVILEHKMTLEQISKIIITKNLDEFVSVFDTGSEFFKDFKEQAMKESNFLISRLGEYIHQ